NDDIPMPATPDPGAGLHPHERRLRAVCGADATVVTSDQVRAARRAYYGAISYFDGQIARLLAVLRDTGRLHNTVIIVTSDHGEMLGERGAWYKMSCYEGAVRVPLIIWSPRRFAARKVTEPVSTMDLLPTLAGLAGAGDPREDAGPLDGRSLLPH